MSMGARHLPTKHQSSGNPVSRRTGASTSGTSREQAQVGNNRASVGKVASAADQFAALEDAQNEIASRQARLVEELVEAQVRQAMDRATAQFETHIGDCLARGMRSFQGQVDAVGKESADSCHQMRVHINLLETGLSSRIQQLEQALEATTSAAQAKEAETSMRLQLARDLDELHARVRSEAVERQNLATQLQTAMEEAAQAENERHAHVAAELKTEFLALIDCERKARQEFQRAFLGNASKEGSTHFELWKLRKSISELSKKHNRRLDEISLRIEVVVASMAHSAKAEGKTAEREAFNEIVDVDEDIPEEAQPPIAWTRSMNLRQVMERQALLTELVTHAMEGGLRYKAPQAGSAGNWDSSSSAALPKQPSDDAHAVRVDLVLAALGGDPRGGAD